MRCKFSAFRLSFSGSERLQSINCKETFLVIKIIFTWKKNPADVDKNIKIPSLFVSFYEREISFYFRVFLGNFKHNLIHLTSDLYLSGSNWFWRFWPVWSSEAGFGAAAGGVWRLSELRRSSWWRRWGKGGAGGGSGGWGRRTSSSSVCLRLGGSSGSVPGETGSYKALLASPWWSEGVTDDDADDDVSIALVKWSVFKILFF